jgi:hypothetical protein
MPDISAEGADEEARAGDDDAREGGHATVLCPSTHEYGKEYGHRQIHYAVVGRTDYADRILAPFESPMLNIVFLEDTICHCEPWDISRVMAVFDLAHPILALEVVSIPEGRGLFH